MSSTTTRTVWLGVIVMAMLLVVMFVLHPFDRNETRQQYTDFLPPDTVHWRSPVMDSIGRAQADCFHMTVPQGWNWYLSDSALGYGEDVRNPGHRVPANARTYLRDKAVVVKRRSVWDLELIAHEWRHLLKNRDDHPASIFTRVCP